jgi:hypothetical protein
MNIYSIHTYYIYFLIYFYMPNRDKTGPEGKGPLTGQGFGNCSSDEEQTPLTERPRFGQRRNFGRNQGRGRMNGRGRNW